MRALALMMAVGIALGSGASATADLAATQPAERVYTIRRAPGAAPPLDGAWDGPAWGGVPALDIDRFHPASSDHRPRTQAKLLYDDRGLYAFFRVEDRYVRSVTVEPQGPVSTDSAVELFLQPLEGRGYFCIETNCGGTFLFQLIEPPGPAKPGEPGEPGKNTPVSPEWLAKVRFHASLPRVVEPEIKGPLTWTLAYFVPFELLAHYLGVEALPLDRPWRANLFKVAESNSHPHYAAWRSIGEPLSFHQPDRFGTLAFERQ